MIRSKKRKIINRKQLGKVKVEEEVKKPLKQIKKIRFGRHELNTPYPSFYFEKDVEMLYLCDNCLNYWRSEYLYEAHFGICPHNYPPGREIYRKDEIGIWEVDGADQENYCQNLCVMAKLFLEFKLRSYNAMRYRFYVICEITDSYYYFAGYFSKEKRRYNSEGMAINQVDSIKNLLILPPYENKGYGRLLIDLSYVMLGEEKKVAPVARPLSEKGRYVFLTYWSWVILETMCKYDGNLTIPELSQKTFISERDIYCTLILIDLDCYTIPGRMLKEMGIAEMVLSEHKKNPLVKKPTLLIDRSCLNWWPRSDDLPVHVSIPSVTLD